MAAILLNKHYGEPSIFLPENLLREARRQRNIPYNPVPEICLLDPDGDLATYLIASGQATENKDWACYHSKMYHFMQDGQIIGIVPCIVGSSYAVLVAEQLFVSGCAILISITSAGIINPDVINKRFTLLTEAVRDEGTSYHYIPADARSLLSPQLYAKLVNTGDDACPYFTSTSWTTDAPYRETQSAIDTMLANNICCVEMEAAALYAFAIARKKDVICFAHLTNTMALAEGDFEKGEHFGSVDSLHLLSYVLQKLLRGV